MNGAVTLWWLEQYGGGLFLPLRDAAAGTTHVRRRPLPPGQRQRCRPGRKRGTVVIDFNFLYHPSCRYSARWQCPLAPAENTVEFPVQAGKLAQLGPPLRF